MRHALSFYDNIKMFNFTDASNTFKQQLFNQGAVL